MKLMTLQEVAAMFKVTKATIINWIKLEGFPSHSQIGGTKYWEEDEVIQYYRSRKGR